MNCSAEKASRKWAYGAFGRTVAAMVTVAAVAASWRAARTGCCGRGSRPAPWADLFGDGPPRLRGTLHRAAVPLPRPRPAEAPKAQSGKAEPGKPAAESAGAWPGGKPAEQAAPAPQPSPQPSACRLALTEAIAIAPSIPDIQGPGGCGGEDLVRLEAIVLPDKRRVAVKPAAILRCTMATAHRRLDPHRHRAARRQASAARSAISTISIRSNAAAATASPAPAVRARPRQCARRARAQTRRWPIDLADRPHRAARGARNRAAFGVRALPTVLGPGSDWYHEDHIHLDLMERRNNYRICQWNVWDPLPQIAPLLPAGASGGSAAARGRRQIRCDQARCAQIRGRTKPDAGQRPTAGSRRSRTGDAAANEAATKKRR